MFQILTINKDSKIGYQGGIGMQLEEKLLTLMKKGWTIEINCAGKGKEDELTYKVKASRMPQPGDTQKLISLSFYPIYMEGKSLHQLIAELEKEINKKIGSGLMI